MQDTSHLLASRRFLPLFITQFLGAFNDNAFKNAFLIWFTYDMADHMGMDARIMVTLAAGLFVLPFFLLSATAGRLADCYDKSRLSRYIKLIEIVLMIACSICFYVQSVYGLLVVLFLMGMQSTFFSPIKYSLIPEHLHKNELIAGNGLVEGGTFIAILIGTIFGGLIIRHTYGLEILSACLIGFAVIGWISSLYIPSTVPRLCTAPLHANIIAEIRHVLSHARREPIVWQAIMGISWFWLVGITFITQFPTYTQRVVSGDETVVTLFLTLFSVGIAAGSVWCNHLLKGEINTRIVPPACFGMGVSIAVFVVCSYQFMEYAYAIDYLRGAQEFTEAGIYAWGIMAAILLLSVCSGLFTVPLYAMMQHRSRPQVLARVIAANNILNSLFMVGASLLALCVFELGFTLLDLLIVIAIANTIVWMMLRRQPIT